ncbi:MAG TPA: TPM domain-containing protein, partial [Longimicrobiaceae bacterium]|nr:TPM domain-containing protein [Longimicrobiaceae bacterium]
MGYVNDFANVIEPAYRDSIQRVIDEVRAKSGGEIVVVTLPSLEGRPPEEVARQIGRDWKVGQKGDPTDQRRNTGAVVLVSMRDRKWRIETGTGAMTFVTAAEAGRIGRDYMLPQLQRGNEGRGLLMAVAGLAQQYAREYGFQLTGDVPAPAAPAAEPTRGRRGRSGGGSFWIFVIIFVIVVMSRRGGGGRGGRGRRGGWGGPVIIPFPM